MEQNSGLIWNLKNGDLEEVQKCIERNPENVKTEIAGRFPIHHAADCGQLNIIEYLLEKGADINQPQIFVECQKGMVFTPDRRNNQECKDKHGLTALHSAVFEGHTQCVDLLLQKGATKEPAPGGTPLIKCAEKQEIIELLK